MKKLKKGKIVAALIILVIIIVLLFLVFNKDNKTPNDNNNKPVVINPNNIIKNYDYVLLDSRSKIYKDIFNSLKDNLESAEIDFMEYSKDLSHLFILEFYDLNNITSKMDIGGVDFVHKDIRENFILNAQNTLYKTLETNVYGDRDQELPKIKNVTINDSVLDEFKYNDTTYPSYIVSATIEYEKDLGYPTNIEITLLKENHLLSIVEIK